MKTDELLREARELYELLSPGPWVRYGWSKIYRVSPGGGCVCETYGSAEVDFIARSRTLVPELCEALEEAQKEIERFQSPLPVIQEKWEPSRCPRCNADYHDYEPCDDGYYDRATYLERCPYCGQKLDWYTQPPKGE